MIRRLALYAISGIAIPIAVCLTLYIIARGAGNEIISDLLGGNKNDTQ